MVSVRDSATRTTWCFSRSPSARLPESFLAAMPASFSFLLLSLPGTPASRSLASAHPIPAAASPLSRRIAWGASRPADRAADRRFLLGTGRPAAPAARLYPCPRESSPAMPLNSAKPSEFARIREGFHRHASELRFPPIVARYGCRLLFAAPPP